MALSTGDRRRDTVESTRTTARTSSGVRQAAHQPQLVSVLPAADHGTRTRVAGELQSAIGNRQLARLIAEHRRLDRQPQTAGPTQQRADQNAAPATGTQASITSLWGIEMTRCDQIASFLEFLRAAVEKDQNGVEVDASMKTRGDLLITEATSWADYLKSKGSASISAEDAASIKAFLSELGQFRKDLAWARGAPARAELRRAKREAEDLARRYEELRPHLDEAMRMAFKADEESLLADLADKAGTGLDIGLGIHELSRDISEWIASSMDVELAEASKFTRALSLANKGLAAISLAVTLTQKQATTELEEGAREIGAAASAFSALVTLTSLPPHVALYADLYLVPMTKVCVALIGKLAEYAHEENRSWVELEGEPLNFAVEPGGEKMWKYMVAVMKAGDKLPAIPADVKSYFLHHRDEFAAGARGELPVEGWVFKDIDEKEFPSWLRAHRAAVWAMLYGSWRVPR